MEGREALDLAIKGGARNLGRDDIGEIAPGFAADFVAWDTGAIGFAGAGKDLVAALVLCTPTIGFVDLSVINGRIVVQDGKLTTLDVKVTPSLLPLILRVCASPGLAASRRQRQTTMPERQPLGWEAGGVVLSSSHGCIAVCMRVLLA